MSDSDFRPYDPSNDSERLSFWSDLLVGKKIKNLIFKQNKTAFVEDGVKKNHPGCIGFVVEDEDGTDTPVYITPGALGEFFGTFLVYYDNNKNFIYAPAEDLK